SYRNSSTRSIPLASRSASAVEWRTCLRECSRMSPVFGSPTAVAKGSARFVFSMPAHIASRQCATFAPVFGIGDRPHPDWNEEQWWPELVSSYAIELGNDFLLVDPLSVPDELRQRATAVVLTAPYHERDAR